MARPSAATITAPMMLDVPRPLPLGIAAKVVSSIPPPKASRIFLRVFLPVRPLCGERPDRTIAALASAKLPVAWR